MAKAEDHDNTAAAPLVVVWYDMVVPYHHAPNFSIDSSLCYIECFLGFPVDEVPP